MTDKELRDLAVAELRLTTVGYTNTHWKVPPPTSHWAKAMVALAKIRGKM
jgi:hypothetical protein